MSSTGGGGAGGGGMSTEQLFQQVALLRWLLSQSDQDRQTVAVLTGLRVGRDLLDRITCRPQVDAYKAECVLSIAAFLQQNPAASQAQVGAVVQRSVLLFAARVHALEAASVF